MKNTKGKDGGVLVMVMVVMLAFAILAIGLLRLHDTDALETVYVKQSAEAFWIAEAGLQSTLTKLRRSGSDGTDYRDSVLGVDEASATIIGPVTVENGSYTVKLWGDSSISNFWMTSRGTVMGQSRLLSLNASLTPFGPHGLVTLNGDSLIRDGATINGSIYQNGKLTTRGDVDIAGDVLAGNHEDFAAGIPIPEDGYIEMNIDQSYFADYLALGVTGATIVSNTLDLLNGTVVVDSSIDPEIITSTGGPGVLVVLADQTFSKDLTVGDDITIIVRGDLKISKNGTLGDDVTIFATGEVDLFKHATAAADTGTGTSILSLGNAKVWKEFTFDGIFFTEGTFYADKDLTVRGTIITEDGFTLKKDATVTFDQSLIPEETYNDMITLSFIVSQSTWNELPAN